MIQRRTLGFLFLTVAAACGNTGASVPHSDAGSDSGSGTGGTGGGTGGLAGSGTATGGQSGGAGGVAGSDAGSGGNVPVDAASNTPDAAADAPADRPAAVCPKTTVAIPAGAEVIDDFAGAAGPLSGHKVMQPKFTVTEDFDAAVSASFTGSVIDSTCGGAAPGSAHIVGTVPVTGGTFFVMHLAGAAGAASYDATKNFAITFSVALGSSLSTSSFNMQFGVEGEAQLGTHAVDFTAASTWTSQRIKWTMLTAATGAINLAKLDRIAIYAPPPGGLVDLYFDDMSFVQQP